MDLRVKIKKAEPHMWYSDVVGMEFDVWKNPNMPGVYFVNQRLFILGEDCEIKGGKKEEIIYDVN